MHPYLIVLLSLLLGFSGLAMTRVRDLFALIVLLSVYSGLMASLFALLGAVDVAFTEAVVGTGLSTVFYMALIRRTDPDEVAYRRPRQRLLATVVALAVGGVLLYGVNALPEYGAVDAPAAQHVAPYYIEHSYEDMHTPNVVTAVLADYRGLDTLVETAVVFTAALGCLLILSRRRENREPTETRNSEPETQS